MRSLPIRLIVGAVFATVAIASQNRLVSASQSVDFAHEVAPILREYCVKCHVGDNKSGGLSINSREDILAGGDSGPVLDLDSPEASSFLERIESHDEGIQMPPEGDRVAPEKILILKRWIAQGAPWQEAFQFQRPAYEPPLLPRQPILPEAYQGRNHPIDRIIDRYTLDRNKPLPNPIDDNAFLRRLTLDLTGLLPSHEDFNAFSASAEPDKRSQAIDRLLADEVAYAEHWLTFWNDLLRNDYDGTGFITGGRQQISTWLYETLIQNKPYDQFVKELIAPPTNASRGFIDGIQWRGEVSAGQTVEIQFAQSVSQSLLGINLKCASCHDSFIDRWKLDEAYGLAAIYSSRPLEIHRCEKPMGSMASAKWLFPELGDIDPNAEQPERLKQLAALLTHPQNGRFTRTIVNRLWHQMMGRGIVHPTDAMQTEPWDADLLDFLASDFAENGYDLKHTMRLIASSQAYQSRCEILKNVESAEYQYAGPRAKRMTAEQFVDTLWQITGSAPRRMDAPFVRGKSNSLSNHPSELAAKWIWSSDNSDLPLPNEKRTFRKRFHLLKDAELAAIVATCDNAFEVYLDGKKLGEGKNWGKPETFIIDGITQGDHEIVIVGVNQGEAPNPAGLLAQIQIGTGPESMSIPTDTSWEWTDRLPNENGLFDSTPDNWQPASIVSVADVWKSVHGDVSGSLDKFQRQIGRMMRASLLKSDPLMRTLGRPNRDQIVSMRPNDLSTLEALDLENGEQIANIIHRGAKGLLDRDWKSPSELIHWIFQQALSRSPTQSEEEIALELLGAELNARNIEDLLWAVVMLPEYQIVR